MKTDYIFRKVHEVFALKRTVDEIDTFLDERISREQEKADALPDYPQNPAWDDRKLLYMKNVHAYGTIQNYLLSMLIDKHRESTASWVRLISISRKRNSRPFLGALPFFVIKILTHGHPSFEPGTIKGKCKVAYSA